MLNPPSPTCICLCRNKSHSGRIGIHYLVCCPSHVSTDNGPPDDRHHAENIYKESWTCRVCYIYRYLKTGVISDPRFLTHEWKSTSNFINMNKERKMTPSFYFGGPFDWFLLHLSTFCAPMETLEMPWVGRERFSTLSGLIVIHVYGTGKLMQSWCQVGCHRAANPETSISLLQISDLLIFKYISLFHT